MQPEAMPLTEEEKLKFKKIFDDLSLATIESIYQRKFGKPYQSNKRRRIKNRIIQELLNTNWTYEEKENLVEYYLDVLRKSKPIAAYILRVGEDVTWETIEGIVTEDRADLSSEPIVKGFIIDDPDNNKFSYWYPYFYGFFTETGKYVKITYPVSIPLRFDSEEKILYIEDSVPFKFMKIFSVLNDKLPLRSVLSEDSNGEDIKDKFEEFIDDIRAILIIKRTIQNSDSGGTIIRRRKPPANSEEQENQVIDVDELIQTKFIPKLQEMESSKSRIYLSLINPHFNNKSVDEIVSYLQSLQLPAEVKVKELFSIKDVDIDVREIELDDFQDPKLRNKLEGIDDLLRVELKGDRDIFKNETVNAYLQAGGRLVGINGTLHYGIGVYEFSLKHGVGFRTAAIPGYIKVKRQNKDIIESDEERKELEEVFNLLLSLYLCIFLS